MSEGITGTNTFFLLLYKPASAVKTSGINNDHTDGFCSWKFKHRKATDIFNVDILEGNTFPDLCECLLFQHRLITNKNKNKNPPGEKLKAKNHCWNMVGKILYKTSFLLKIRIRDSSILIKWNGRWIQGTALKFSPQIIMTSNFLGSGDLPENWMLAPRTSLSYAQLHWHLSLTWDKHVYDFLLRVRVS